MTDDSTFAEDLPSIDSAQIASAILELLRERDDPTEPMLLSSLGQRLSAHFGRSLRTLLEGKRLSEVVGNLLGAHVKLEGDGNRRAVRLSAQDISGSPSLRYDSRFWAAFSKPLVAGLVRHLDTKRPFNFEDRAEDSNLESDAKLIVAGDIPSTDLPKPERDAAIRLSIDAWCAHHSLKTSDFFLRSAKVRERKNSGEADFNVAGVSALQSMIEAVPTAERRSYTISLDLIHRLLKK